MKPEAQNPKLETRNPKPQVDSLYTRLREAEDSLVVTHKPQTLNPQPYILTPKP